MNKTIVIGCDNAAVSMKNQLKAYMEAAGYTVRIWAATARTTRSTTPMWPLRLPGHH